MGVGRAVLKQQTTFAVVCAEFNPLDPRPCPSPQGGGEKSYAASALAGFSGAVMAPEALMSVSSFVE